jgi:formate dehydrogenase assembly factor FdhD
VPTTKSAYLKKPSTRRFITIDVARKTFEAGLPLLASISLPSKKSIHVENSISKT